MRPPTVLGASLLLAAGLTAGLAAGPAVALPAGHGDWSGTGDSRTGGSWDGGSATADGERYSWPEDTRTWDDNVCPDMDEPKTDVDGEKQTITLHAPEGELISAYCVKAGSAKRGEGPKIVELDVPVAEITIAYPTGGKCRAISHYAVEYVDAPAPSPTPETATTPPTEPLEPAEQTTPPADDGNTPAEESPTPTPQAATEAPPAEPSPTASETAPAAVAEQGPSDDVPAGGAGGADDAEAVETRAQTGTVSTGRVSADVEAAAASQSLPVTGAQVLGLVMAAVALVGAGVGALIWTRQRRAS
ncbi:dihydrolipoyllysine-residue succinyltransferase component of 2-oxoglutarate dehydrogenase complex [Krasilnikoviella flava]|uniref:LPXTG-motif cell wall anchor domain-containing protein n=1 Tax=Krasilnikoviella flava TaxID=526729 RepID=A0A1T5ICH7_9MICO|nr:hypothetical protein [Krasilnikoviella flava]SKC36901.1 hypothetical protein SAMN04324258_0334 [Krasilnikoviella flava]